MMLSENIEVLDVIVNRRKVTGKPVRKNTRFSVYYRYSVMLEDGTLLYRGKSLSYARKIGKKNLPKFGVLRFTWVR